MFFLIVVFGVGFGCFPVLLSLLLLPLWLLVSSRRYARRTWLAAWCKCIQEAVWTQWPCTPEQAAQRDHNGFLAQAESIQLAPSLTVFTGGSSMPTGHRDVSAAASRAIRAIHVVGDQQCGSCSRIRCSGAGRKGQASGRAQPQESCARPPPSQHMLLAVLWSELGKTTKGGQA